MAEHITPLSAKLCGQRFAAGIALLADNDFEGAVVALKEAVALAQELDLGERLVDCLLSLADAYRLQGRSRLAFATVNRALKHCMRDATISELSSAFCYGALGQMYMDGGEYFKAEAPLSRAIGSLRKFNEVADQDFLPIYHAAVHCNFMRSRFIEADALANHALSLCRLFYEDEQDETVYALKLTHACAVALGRGKRAEVLRKQIEAAEAKRQPDLKMATCRLRVV